MFCGHSSWEHISSQLSTLIHKQRNNPIPQTELVHPGNWLSGKTLCTPLSWNALAVKWLPIQWCFPSTCRLKLMHWLMPIGGPNMLPHIGEDRKYWSVLPSFCPCPNNFDQSGSIWIVVETQYPFKQDGLFVVYIFSWLWLGLKKQCSCFSLGAWGFVPTMFQELFFSSKNYQVLSWFLVETAEQMNLTWLAGTYWSHWILLMKYPVVLVQLGSFPQGGNVSLS